MTGLRSLRSPDESWDDHAALVYLPAVFTARAA
jgi:hypothetical protein